MTTTTMFVSAGAVAGVGLGLGLGLGVGVALGVGTGVGLGLAAGEGVGVAVVPGAPCDAVGFCTPEPPHPAEMAKTIPSARMQDEENRSRGFNSEHLNLLGTQLSALVLAAGLAPVHLL